VRCGFVRVPESHEAANGRLIKLAIAVFAAPNSNPDSGPLVYLAGGPGGAIVASLGATIAASGLPAYVGNRDLILIDQRGAGLSRPSLNCPEVDEAQYVALDKHLSEPQTLTLLHNAHERCRTRLIRAHINLAAYNTVENAADISDVAAALGYSQVNIYGGSYGSSLALQVMRDHPQGIRSVTIDAIAGPTFNEYNDYIPNTWQSLQRLFSDCAATPGCNKASPHLMRTFEHVVARLQRHPATISLFSTQRGRSFQVKVTGAALAEALNGMLANFNVLPYVPELVTEVNQGDFSPLVRILTMVGWGADSGTSEGMYLSMECSSDQATSSREKIAERATMLPGSVRRQVVARRADALAECAIWHVPSLPSVNRTLFKSGIPTLLLAGRYDPKTSPQTALVWARVLSRSYPIVFPTRSHGVVGTGPCSDEIVSEFLASPDHKPSTTCLGNIAEMWP
jgi:pimeloyl-ACP methyl ester carboxylesterase